MRGFNVNVQVLAGPVVGIYCLDGNLLISKQRDKVLAGRAARRENSRSFAAKVSNRARHINASSAGFEDGYAAA
ncbi:hypothetical protein D3C71_1979850 [compost metagenome]